MRRLVAIFAVVFAAAAGATQAAAQPSRVGDRAICSGNEGTIIRIEPRAGWDEPFLVVGNRSASGVEYEFRCTPSNIQAEPGAAAQGNAGSTRANNQPLAQAPTPANGASLCRPGARIEGQWGIEWYAVTVRGPLDANGECPISFDGYGRSWDMPISADQLRPRGSGAIRRPTNPIADGAPATQQQTGGTPPNGTYRCHKISPGGQLMHIGILTVRGSRATLAGLPAGWTVRGVYVRGTNNRGQLVVAYDYRSSAGFNDSLDCLRA